MPLAMVDTSLLLELVLRGTAIGGLAASAIAFYRDGASLSVRIAGLLFCLSVIAYVLNSSPVLRQAMDVWGAPVTFVSLGGGGYFWLFVYTLFEDRRIYARDARAGSCSHGVRDLIGLLTSPPTRNAVLDRRTTSWKWRCRLHALFVIYRSWRGDLVEARRQLRGPFMAIVTIYVITLSAIEIGESVGVAAAWYSLAGALALASFCVAGTDVFPSSAGRLVRCSRTRVRFGGPGATPRRGRPGHPRTA